jgi:hypothetical protein
MLQVYAAEKVRARQALGVNDHRIQEGNSIQPVQFDSRVK